MNIFIVNYLSKSANSICSLNAIEDLQAGLNNIGNFYIKPEQGLFTKESAKDRGLNYGDGCFTTIYSESNSIFLCDEHFQRLARDCQKLNIEVCLDTAKHWLLLALKHVDTKDHKAYAIKVVVSRGIGGRGYELPQDPNTTVIISLHPSQSFDLVCIQRDDYHYRLRQAKMYLSSQPLLAGIKHLNRLEQVMAKRELQQYDCDDLLLCDQAGNLIESTAANIFYYKNGVWFTPELASSGVSGVMREAVLAFFQEQGSLYEVKVSLFTELLDADAIFLCNAIKFIIPVSALTVNSNVYHFDLSPANTLGLNLYNWIRMQKSLTFER
jgi:4-amino-4-deoxychorismate lyase